MARRPRMKRLALGAAIGTAVGVVLDRLHVTRSRSGGWSREAHAVWNPNPSPGQTASDTRPAEDEVDPNDLTSPGTVSDPRLEEQRAREAAERELESRRS